MGTAPVSRLADKQRTLVAYPDAISCRPKVPHLTNEDKNNTIIKNETPDFNRGLFQFEIGTERAHNPSLWIRSTRRAEASGAARCGGTPATGRAPAVHLATQRGQDAQRATDQVPAAEVVLAPKDVKTV